MDSLDRDDVTPSDDDIIDDVDDFPDDDRGSTGSLSNTPRNGLRSSLKETFKNVTSKTSSRVNKLLLMFLNCSLSLSRERMLSVVLYGSNVTTGRNLSLLIPFNQL
jgi:hypothetical protein